MSTSQRVALVTGANRGIGLEVVRQLALQGYRTVLSARNLEAAQSAAATLRQQKLDVVSVKLDVDDLTSIEDANAAVLLAEHEGILRTSLDDVRATLTTNIVGAFAVARAFVPGMMKRKYGRVVNVSSTAGQLSSMSTYAPAYSISKAALNALTRQLAAATHRHGVLVNSACPGWVRTDMGGSGAPLSVAQGADTIVWLATLPDDGPTGGFFRERRRIEW
jgi:NAD(P)-dependent dehydrogenase (short-subunit alcohol dehydrogenase family)